MELLISAKHFDIDAEQRELAESQARKLGEDFNKLTSLRLVLSKERNWQIAEAHLNGKNLTLNAKARSTDLRVSISNVIEKLDKQLRRYMEKIIHHSHLGSDAAQKEWTSAELQMAEDDADLVGE